MVPKLLKLEPHPLSIANIDYLFLICCAFKAALNCFCTRRTKKLFRAVEDYGEEQFTEVQQCTETI